jgi:hypothetical protein
VAASGAAYQRQGAGVHGDGVARHGVGQFGGGPLSVGGAVGEEE